MNMDILAILMVALGLFAILLFILFYIYARDARNKKRNDIDSDFGEISDDEMEKFRNIDKDFDNIVDEDIDKDDLSNLNVKTDQMEDFNDDGSLINSQIDIKPIDKEEEIQYSNEDNEEFVPKRKKTNS